MAKQKKRLVKKVEWELYDKFNYERLKALTLGALTFPLSIPIIIFVWIIVLFKSKKKKYYEEV